MKIVRFTKGRYGLHGITGSFKGTVSAWFDCRGVMFDAEQILEPFGRVRHVKEDGPIWRQCQKIGQRYQHVPAP